MAHHIFSFFISLGFRGSLCDTSLFVYQHGDKLAYLLLYVDDIVIIASDPALLDLIISCLSGEFAMSDLGPLHHFLGISITWDNGDMFLSQAQYARDILHRAAMTACNPCSTPVDTSSKLSATKGARLVDGTLYRSIPGALQYLTFTTPDIAYAMQQICLLCMPLTILTLPS